MQGNKNIRNLLTILKDEILEQTGTALPEEIRQLDSLVRERDEEARLRILQVGDDSWCMCTETQYFPQEPIKRLLEDDGDSTTDTSVYIAPHSVLATYSMYSEVSCAGEIGEAARGAGADCGAGHRGHGGHPSHSRRAPAVLCGVTQR